MEEHMSKKITTKNDFSEGVMDIDPSEADEVVGGLSFSFSTVKKLSVQRAFASRRLGAVAYCTSGGCTSHHCGSGFVR
jgi:hypothetical protein